MCVCLYVCVCVSMCVCVYLCACVSVCMSVCGGVYVSLCLCVCGDACFYVHLFWLSQRPSLSGPLSSFTSFFLHTALLPLPFLFSLPPCLSSLTEHHKEWEEFFS